MNQLIMAKIKTIPKNGYHCAYYQLKQEVKHIKLLLFFKAWPGPRIKSVQVK